ncbi:MAG: methylenetetrahydrofolate reductase [Granulosicoccaceae bacterium]
MTRHLTALPTNSSNAPKLSFEFFPPKNERMQRCLWRNIGQLELLAPSFFSVTYGAGGSDRERSLETLRHMQQECPVPLAAHLTHAGHSKNEVLEIAQQLYQQGIRSLVALRGDAESVEGGFEHTEDFIAELKSCADFDISVAAYPEVHPLAKSAREDIEQLRRKLDAGANRAVTQYFFDIDSFLRFRDQAAAAGIDKAIVPGILPIHHFERVVAFSERCGAVLPDSLFALFEGTEGNTQVQHTLASDLAVGMCHALQSEGVLDFHFYTLNTPSLSFDIARQIGAPLVSAAARAA